MTVYASKMLEALGAREPHRDVVAHEHAIYAPLIGSWNLEVFDLEGDGARRVMEGEWHFGWVLEGRAIQDVLIAPPRGERHNGTPIKTNRYGTNLRIFDPATGVWRVHFLNPVTQICEVFTAQQEGKDIVQKGTDANNASVREIFSDIAPDAFVWRREISNDFGSWKLKSEYLAKRRGDGGV